jgi:hypothetical protein
MGRDTTKNQTPDLFSTERLDGSPSNNPPQAVPGRPSRRAALLKDLPRAIRYLEDRELDLLLRAAIEEAKRRGRPMPLGEAGAGKTVAASSTTTSKYERPTRQRDVGLGPALTQG